MDLSFASIGDTAQLREELLRIISAIRKGAVSEPVSRVAIFLHFVALVSSLAEANRLLLQGMPHTYRMGISDEEDFVFQINRPRVIGEIANTRMNFITKWSADRFQLLNIAVPIGSPIPGQLGQPPVSLQPKEYLAASVTFDNNNIGGQEPLSSGVQAALLAEGLTRTEQQMLRDCGMNIAGF